MKRFKRNSCLCKHQIHYPNQKNSKLTKLKGVDVAIAKDEDGANLDLKPSKGEDGLNLGLEALENVDGVNPNPKTSIWKTWLSWVDVIHIILEKQLH